MNRLRNAMLLGTTSALAMVAYAPNGLGSATAVDLDHPATDKATTGDYQPIDPQSIGLSGKVLLVHKLNEEGMLQIDAVTGFVLPGQLDTKPDWAGNLSTAQLAERTQFYVSRTGKAPAADPEAVAFEDLAWLTLDENGNETLLEADAEFRMDAVATILGVDRETGAVTAAIVDGEIARDDYRTDEQMAALTDAQRNRSFEDSQKQARTGTAG